MTTKVVEHNGRSVSFSEKNHLYLLDDGRQLTSGTTFVKRFFPVFDSKKVSFFYAKKHGLDQQQVLAMWREKGERASCFGTNVHACGEAITDLYAGRAASVPRPQNQDEKAAFVKVAGIVKAMSEYLEFIESEKIIFSPEMCVAGTIDLLARHKKTREIYIIDWKTNEKIVRDTAYNKFGFAPIGHMPDCNYSHYSLQVNLYQNILAREAYFTTPGYKRILIHINQNSFEWIDVPCRQTEIEAMAA